MDWIKGAGGVHAAIDTSLNQTHLGSIKYMDGLHAVQNKGRGRYAIHLLADLDNVPALDDPKTTITYLDGVGKVSGRLGQWQGVGR